MNRQRAREGTGSAAGGSATDVLHALGERVKELNCLYGIARLAERHPDSMDDIVVGALQILPPAWQYPSVARARIVLRGRRRQSPGFGRVVATQSALLRVGDEAVGEVVVGYVRSCPASYEGPFLREERALIEGVAEYLGVIAGRIESRRALAEAHRLLSFEREALREANGALRAVLARSENERRELRIATRAGVDRVLLPILQALERELPASKRAYVDLLRSSLLNMDASFAGPLSAAAPQLTPAEIAVCTMIRGGLDTKEIARLRGIAPSTVTRHRESIRRKLGLAHRPLNLVAYLQALTAERLILDGKVQA